MPKGALTHQPGIRLALGFGLSLTFACQSTPLGVPPQPPTDPAPCPTPLTNGRCIRVLASGQPSPSALAVTSSEVVWGNTGVEIAAGETRLHGATILKVPLSGGAPETLATVAPPETISHLSSLAVDSGSVYWAKYDSGSGDGAIMKTPLAGGATTTFAPAPASLPSYVAVSGGVVYWEAQTGIMSASTSGGPPALFAPAAPWTLAAGKAYWFGGDGDDWALRTRALAPGAGEVTLTAWNSSELPRSACLPPDRNAISVYGLAVSATDLYWSADVASAGCLMKVPLSGGTPSAISQGAGAGAVVLDADSIYWFDRSSPDSFLIQKAPLAGGSPTTVATSVGQVWSIAVDDTSLYFADASGGTIVKVTPK
jgi:hypothetical protein